MASERIINMHAHIFPMKISEKAVGAIGDFYGIKMQIKGTPEYICLLYTSDAADE